METAMIKAILGIIAVVVVAVVGMAATKPDNFVITRSTVINATATNIFPHINNLRLWDAWSPWAKMDPQSKVTFTGPEAGVGASMKWESQKDELGIGTMTITESIGGEKIVMKLDFEKPMAANNISEFTFKPSGMGTEVTWSLKGKADFMGKIMDVIFNCDKMVGDMYEKGFASLKAVVEK